MCLKPIFVKGNYYPCRKCIECKIQYSEDWARRVMLESKKHKENTFITLTYNDANLPKEGVCKRSAQLFMKKLRKAIAPVKVRYFLCGEYGAEKNRPHYHVILFGYEFKDKFFHGYDRRGNAIYRSPLLEKIWSFGFSSVGDRLDFETAKYCAKYMQADCREFDNLGLARPFTLMSRRPGLALDVIPDSVYKSGDIYMDGKRYLAPRAFLKKVKQMFPEYYEQIISIKKMTAYEKLKNSLHIQYDFEFLAQDDSIKALSDELFWQKFYNEYVSRETRKKKYKRIFGKSLDKDYRIVVNLKRKVSMRKT